MLKHVVLSATGVEPTEDQVNYLANIIEECEGNKNKHRFNNEYNGDFNSQSVNVKKPFTYPARMTDNMKQKITNSINKKVEKSLIEPILSKWAVNKFKTHMQKKLNDINAENALYVEALLKQKPKPIFMSIEEYNKSFIKDEIPLNDKMNVHTVKLEPIAINAEFKKDLACNCCDKKLCIGVGYIKHQEIGKHTLCHVCYTKLFDNLSDCNFSVEELKAMVNYKKETKVVVNILEEI